VRVTGKAAKNIDSGARFRYRRSMSGADQGVQERQGTERGCVLVLLADGFEEIEALLPVDLLRRAGVEVVTAAMGAGRMVRGRSGIAVEADVRLEDVAAGRFDLLLLPGGPAVAGLRADGRAARLAVEFVRAGRPVAAICAAPLLLRDAGLLEGVEFTAHFSTAGELPEALVERPVVTDGLLITSRGAGTALEFGLAVVAHLRGQAVAAEVARAIMFQVPA
jgi:4-methyl-5(b-hydroxyethyl)-thiazole monophosphate biosynthesis